VGLAQGLLSLIGGLQAYVISAEFVSVVAAAWDVPMLSSSCGVQKKDGLSGKG